MIPTSRYYLVQVTVLFDHQGFNYPNEERILMSKRKPINPDELKVGDMVEWVERPDIWEVEVLDIKDYGIIVDSGYGKKALFAPSSFREGKYTLLVGSMEMDDYLRHPKEKVKKAKVKKTKKSIEPEKFQVGEIIEWVERDGTIWDEKVLAVNGDEVTVSFSWDKRVFTPRPGGDGRHMLLGGKKETDGYIRHPKKVKKK